LLKNDNLKLAELLADIPELREYLMEVGFEYVTGEYDDGKIFRKPN